jgi:hypothetical protein
MSDAEKKRAYFVEVRRGLGIILRASVAYFGVGYLDLLPREATATPEPVYSAPHATPAAEFRG